MKLFKRTKAEVAEVIENFILGKGKEWDWDDFISCPIADSELEKIRICCANLDKEFPPREEGEYCNDEGVKVLQNYVAILKKGDRHQHYSEEQ